jgi:PAS domain S-box-containing protein
LHETDQPPQQRRWPDLGFQAAVVLVVGLLILLGTLLSIGAELLAEQNASDQEVEARQLRQDNINLLVAMVDQESGLRGYTGTGREEFLEPYRSGQAQEAPLLGKLQGEARTAEGQRAVAYLGLTAQSWSDWAAVREMTAQQAGGPVIDPTADTEGKARFDRFREAQERVAQLADAQVQQTRAASNASRDQARRALVIGGSIVFASLVGLAAILSIFTLRPLRRLVAAADELAHGEPATVPDTHKTNEIGRLARALQRWQASEGLHKAMMEHSPIGIYLADLTGKVVEANAELEAMLGYSRTELLDLRFQDFAEPGYRDVAAKLYQEVATGTRDRFKLQVQLRRRNGSVFWSELTLGFLRESGGQPASFVAMVIDISDRKERLAQASAIQRDLLPKVAPMLRGYELAGDCAAAEEVGGDFFDWYLSGPGQLTLSLGDVMGKGISAAILMATVRTALRAGGQLVDPAAAVRLAADAVSVDPDGSHTFVTLLHARLDEPSGDLRLVDAGHGFVFVLRASGQLVQFPRHDLPLGTFAAENYRENRVQLQPGDTFLIFSDGVLDIHPTLERDFEQLSRILEGVSTAREVVERLSRHDDGVQPLDDVTVVALRRSTAGIATVALSERVRVSDHPTTGGRVSSLAASTSA